MNSKVFSLLLCLFIIGCSGSQDKKEESYMQGSVEEIYNAAMDKLFKQKEYKKAAQLFEEVERQYPYSSWATRAQLMAAYAYYENRSYEDAIVNLKNFTQLHPRHKHTPYAMYLLGMSYYVQISGVNRDQEMTYKAFNAFKKLMKTFPGTIYAKDAGLKLVLTKEYLAGQDMEVGRYYQQARIPTAAILRFRNVVKEFQDTSHVAEALHRLVELYIGLDMKQEALKTAAVLGFNYPGSSWYQDTYTLLKGHNLTPQTKEPAQMSQQEPMAHAPKSDN